MKLAFIILAHDDEENLLRLIKRLLVDDDWVVVHWDSKNSVDLQKLAAERLAASELAKLRFAPRVSVQWGTWSVVEATLLALAELEKLPEPLAYVQLLSGSDYPLKPIAMLKAFLSQSHRKEFIECVDAERDTWVVHGMVHERYQRYHWINWRNHPKLFKWSMVWQKKLGVNRQLPAQLRPHFGSQWWALTWETLQQVLQFSRRKAIRCFFQRTWIPDELFFQTLVAACVPKERIAGSNLTFYHFSQQGRPLVFYNGHFDFLSQQGMYFARKLSPQATQLRDQLDREIDKLTLLNEPNGLCKQLRDYDMFIAVQWRGLPGRRVIGRQQDAWYGDLEWNNRPYFVIACHHEASIGPLLSALNTLSGVVCYGEIFKDGYIDYALPEKAHFFYPEQNPALRDMKRPNFLVDLLNANAGALVGFVLRLPSGNEMEKVVIYDPQASLIQIIPENQVLDNGYLNWQSAFVNMIMHDNVSEARKAGKSALVLNTSQDKLSAASINLVVTHIDALKTGMAC